MNRKIKLITRTAMTGALILSLGTGVAAYSNVTSYASTNIGNTTSASAEKGVRNNQNSQRSEMGTIHGKDQVKDDGEKWSFVGRDRHEKGQEFNVDQLYDEELLTEDQVTDIEAYLDTKEVARIAERAILAVMSQEEREAYFEEKATVIKTSLLDELVAEDILTQSEADAIDTYRIEMHKALMEADIREKLAGFVTEGSLESTDVDAIVAYLSDLVQIGMDKTVDNCDETVTSIVDLLVNDGIITQDKADVIEGAFSYHSVENGRH